MDLSKDEMTRLRDDVARSIFERIEKDFQTERAPWREAKWMDAADRAIKQVFAFLFIHVPKGNREEE